MQILTPAQCRAARALLDWSQPELAQRAGMHVQTISSFESDHGTPTKTTLEKIFLTFESVGIEFLNEDGVKRRAQDIKTYMGRDGFTDFMWDVVATVRKFGGDVCVSNVKESWFTEPLTEETNIAYRASMADLKREKKFRFRILIQEADMNFVASAYAEYRWIRPEHFSTASFYVYGNKLALLLFDQGPKIHVVDNADIANAQRVQFNVFWEGAKEPPKG